MMVFVGNYESKRCKRCGRHISRTNFPKHAVSCRRNTVAVDAWSAAAGHLEAIAQDKLSELLISDPERATWEHIRNVVVPFLDKKARTIESRQKKTVGDG